MIRIVKADTSKLEVRAALDWLQAKCFCEAEHLTTEEGYWWIAREGEIPVAFAALQSVPSWDQTAYMARSGVIHSHRGQGIQKRLLKHREQFAKNEQLPMLFAAQFPTVWGGTTKRYVHTGHKHHTHEFTKELSGMTVTQHPTLAARDAYASRGGWMAERQVSSFTYSDKYGQVAKNTVTPEMVG